MSIEPTRRRQAGLVLVVAGLLVNPWLVGRVATSDGTIGSVDAFAVVVLFATACLLGGLQLLVRWVEPLAWGRPVGLMRGALFVGFFAAVVAGVYWGIATFNRGHSHTVIIPAELESATPEQRAWADDFYRRSLVAALEHGWFDYDKAMEQGFQPDRINGDHYPNLEYMFDGVMLDPERPEWLIYHKTPDGPPVLMAMMFFTNSLEEVGPTPAGPIAQWHYHPYNKTRCAIKGLWTVGDADDKGNCAEGIPVTRTPEMFHVWFIDHPLGRYTEMKIVSEYFQDHDYDIRLWHPIAVHFVIALFIVSVLLDLAGSISGRTGWHHAAWLNLVLATIAGIASVALGMTAEVLVKPTPLGHQTLDYHKLLAFSSLAVIGILFAWRYLLRGAFPRKGALLYLVVGLVGVASISGAGYFGGQMVYEHGTAVGLTDRFLREQYWRQVREIYAQPADGLFEAKNLD
ncbi:MAG: DUF2231 domain-containing protein [Gammaproteobacteria bacterium]